MNFKRISLFFAAFFAVLALPWWLSLLGVFFLIIYFPAYIEAIFFGFILDTMYSANYSIIFSYGLYMLLVLILVNQVRDHIRT